MAHFFLLLSLTAFLVTLTETSCSLGGKWAMEINGGIWPTATVLTANEEIIIESDRHPILHQVQGGSATIKPKVRSRIQLWA